MEYVEKSVEFCNRAWAKGHIPALLWLLYGFYIWNVQFDWTRFPERQYSYVDILIWLLNQKEDLISLVVGPGLRLYEYINERANDRQAHLGFVKDTLNVSLNTLIEEEDHDYIKRPTLKFRTIQEVSPSNVFFDKIHQQTLAQLSDETTPENAYLCFSNTAVPHQEIRKIILNYLSSFSADGHIAKEMGFPVREDTFIFALTNERFGGEVAIKLRLMVVREKVLRYIYKEWFLETLLERCTLKEHVEKSLHERVFELLWERRISHSDGLLLIIDRSAREHRVSLFRDARGSDLQRLEERMVEESWFPISVKFRYNCEAARVQAGDSVTLYGLAGKDRSDKMIRLNGKEGICRTWHSASRQWKVDIPGDGTEFLSERYLERRCPRVEAPSHVNRWILLKKMAFMYCDSDDPGHKWIVHNRMTMVRAEVPYLQRVHDMVSALEVDSRSRGCRRPRESDEDEMCGNPCRQKLSS